MGIECKVKGCKRPGNYARGLCSPCWKAADVAGELHNYPPKTSGPKPQKPKADISVWPVRKNNHAPKPGAGGVEAVRTNYGVPVKDRDLPKLDWERIKEQTFV